MYCFRRIRPSSTREQKSKNLRETMRTLSQRRTDIKSANDNPSKTFDGMATEVGRLFDEFDRKADEFLETTVSEDLCNKFVAQVSNVY